MDIAKYVIQSICQVVADPVWIFILIMLAIFLYRGNKKTSLMQKMIMGESVDSALELTLSQIVIGIVAGTIASLILAYLGVMFNENSPVVYLFLISIMLMFFNPRLVCFAYSSGILGAVSVSAELVYKFSNGILKYSDISFLITDITAMMTMVAVLHLIEGILVILDGDKGYIPVFSNRDDKIIGGFAFQRYWVLPVAILLILSKTTVSSAGSSAVAFNTPPWWPLIKAPLSGTALSTAVLGMLPFVGMVGYSSVTFTRNRKEKKRLSGLFIIVYSLLLFAFAQLAALNIVFKILAVIFAPLGHEGMIIYQRYLESKRPAKFINGDEGIMILDVIPSSPASEMGIKSGDTIIEINNKKIDNEQDVFSYIYEHSNFAWLKVKKPDGTVDEINYNQLNQTKKLGLIFIPKIIPNDDAVIRVDGMKFGDILNHVKNKNEKDNNDNNDDHNGHGDDQNQ